MLVAHPFRSHYMSLTPNVSPVLHPLEFAIDLESAQPGQRSSQSDEYFRNVCPINYMKPTSVHADVHFSIEGWPDMNV